MCAERATGEVAKHFYDKYGHDEAVDIISARINSDGAKQDTEFWLDVIDVLNQMAVQGGVASGRKFSRKLGNWEKPSTHS